MGRQAKIEDPDIGRTIIGLTEEQLNDKEQQSIVIVGCDGNRDVELTLDCAYTYFYNGENKVEASSVTFGDTAYAAFLIFDSADEDPITGYGYYRIYRNDAGTEENFLFDALLPVPEV